MTAQIGDYIQYQSKLYQMFSLPLESNPKLNQALAPPNPPQTTACWRGYVALWRIEGQHLQLIEVTDFDDLAKWHTQTPYQSSEPPIAADWYTGTLRLQSGEQLQYVHMGFETRYEHEIHIQIDKGIVRQISEIHNRIPE